MLQTVPPLRNDSPLPVPPVESAHEYAESATPGTGFTSVCPFFSPDSNMLDVMPGAELKVMTT
jgi:hypothetical protein